MDLLFYHLERSPIDRVLPELLMKAMDKGWRAIVETEPYERVEALDQMLWTFRDDSFLPHGIDGQPNSENQPVLLTDAQDNSNNAQIRFFIDAGDVTQYQDYERLVYMFNGLDEDAVKRARKQWKLAKEAGLDVTYWSQNAEGRFEKKA